MKQKILLLIFLLAAVSCGKVVNKGGETVGKTATEFFEGVSEGVDKTLQCELNLSQELQDKGVKTGKYSIDKLPEGGKNNLLILYLIFDKDFKSTVTAKVFDKKGLEIGRAKLDIESKAGNAGYYDFAFDKRTYIEVKSKIVLETLN
ncbi:MAG: hypothetical protein LBN27_11350 [Prevotellaceae bacterium]|jgi:hypothetical protein|nr:hypothetical protein [Prevotellaceae bacterium]